MIGYLSGNVLHKSTENLILLTNGVGYSVNVPTSLLATINKEDKLSLYIHTHVRDDCLDLYGFKTAEELSVFKLLLTVSGIGPKTALIVSNKGVNAILSAISKADVDFFTTVPRLGKKNAQKIIIDLKNKVGGVGELNLSEDSFENQEVISALIAMGYTQREAMDMTKNLSSEATVEEKIRLALRKK